MKITATAIKKQSKQISGIMSKLRKKFFELEMMQSNWEAHTSNAKKYSSAKTLISEVTKGL